MSAPESPCRLFVYLASEAPVALVLRRGPSVWSQLSVWHTDTDKFEHGQWLRGRIYERRCDLSPDGSLFAYFTRKESARTRREVGADSWIALSRPPWFTALALWTIGGTYCTGAFFPDSRSLFISGIEKPPDKGALRSTLRLTNAPPFVDRTLNWTERTVYFSRLLRDGWRAVPEERSAHPWWERASADGRLNLLMMPQSDSSYRAYGGPNVVEYGVDDISSGVTHQLGRATWADWDQRGRLIVAQDGKLLHWRSTGVANEIADFNPRVPDPAPSPAWASDWPAQFGRV